MPYIHLHQTRQDDVLLTHRHHRTDAPTSARDHQGELLVKIEGMPEETP